MILAKCERCHKSKLLQGNGDSWCDQCSRGYAEELISWTDLQDPDDWFITTPAVEKGLRWQSPENKALLRSPRLTVA